MSLELQPERKMSIRRIKGFFLTTLFIEQPFRPFDTPDYSKIQAGLAGCDKFRSDHTALPVNFASPISFPKKCTCRLQGA
jgi:hypothetical protein